MSVLIKGVKLPKSCFGCHLFKLDDQDLWCIANHYAGCCRALSKYIDENKFVNERHPDCPLIEVPTPHLLNDISSATYDACKGALEILERLDTDSDMISRAKAIDGKICIRRSNGVEIYDDYVVPVEYLEQLPPAQPEHIKGRWIPVGGALYQCDQCGAVSLERKFCSDCGAEMEVTTWPSENF